MTDTTTLAPTDAEIFEAAKSAGFCFHDAGYAPTLHTTPQQYSQKCFERFARAILAKWGAPAPASGEPAAYRLKDDEATEHYGKDVYVYYTPNEFKTPAAFKYLEPLYTARVLLDRIARDLLLDVKNRVNALVLLPSSERRESEIRIKQDIADFLAAPPVQEARESCTLSYRIAELAEQHGSLRAAARSLDFDPGYLARLQSGEKCSPSPALLERLGLRQVITYERGTT